MKIAVNAWGDLASERFGHLVATKKVGKDKFGHALWECKCDCGRTSIVRASNLAIGHTTTCGCGRITFKEDK